MKPEITMQDGVALIMLHNIPTDAAFIHSVFAEIAKMNIDVDMISIAPAQSTHTTLAFTVADDDLFQVLGYVSKLKSMSIKPIVSSSNCKITISDKEMEGCPGVAEKIFAAVAEVNTDIRLVTTSESQVSLLMTQAHADAVLNALGNIFD